ncbi:hypothetical protein PR048_001872 [Dryococelus australis]|uniref:Uncharacterized protein n=1 Tax=Dryococelus australis TaxID=614101 RepID=A0ABQ9IL35_9NEOP|nr:hypothetical protein PR048_001872 [Dryococelus australis]
MGVVPDDTASRRVTSGICRSPHPCVPALLQSRLIPPSSALKTSLISLATSHRCLESVKIALEVWETLFATRCPIHICWQQHRGYCLKQPQPKYSNGLLGGCAWPGLTAACCERLCCRLDAVMGWATGLSGVDWRTQFLHFARYCRSFTAVLGLKSQYRHLFHLPPGLRMELAPPTEMKERYRTTCKAPTTDSREEGRPISRHFLPPAVPPSYNCFLFRRIALLCPTARSAICRTEPKDNRTATVEQLTVRMNKGSFRDAPTAIIQRTLLRMELRSRRNDLNKLDSMDHC